MGNGNQDKTHQYIGFAVFLIASVPLLVSGSLAIKARLGRRLGRTMKFVVLGVAFGIGAAGLYQILVDIGDALWSGFPALVLSRALYLALKFYPSPGE